jgi:hypothetical protein
MKHTTRGKVQVMTRGTEKAKMEDPGGCTRPPRPSPASVALRSAERARARATFPKLVLLTSFFGLMTSSAWPVRRIVIVCILLDFCSIASPASPSPGSSTLSSVAEHCDSGCHPEDVLLHIQGAGLSSPGSWPAAAGRDAHLHRFVSGVAQSSRYEARLALVKDGFEVHEQWRQFHGVVDRVDVPEHISFAVPPLAAGSYTEYVEVYDACCLSASLSASEEDDRMVRLLAAFTRAVKVEEAVGNWLSEQAAAPDGSGLGDKEPAGQPREQASVLPQLNSLCFRSSPASESSSLQSEDSDPVADNHALPLGRNLAIVMVGLFHPTVTIDCIISLLDSIQELYGQQADAVHFFLHVEPAWTSASHEEAVEYIHAQCEEELGERLKGLIVRSAGTLIGKMFTRQARQFNRLQECFEMVLGQECLEGFRYTHVVRTRTDILFPFPWQATPALLSADVPHKTTEAHELLSAFVPHNTIAGPGWGCRLRPANTCVLKNDQFWIASRSRAWLMFVVLPFTFSRRPPIKNMSSVLQCQDPVEAPSSSCTANFDKTFLTHDTLLSDPHICDKIPELLISFFLLDRIGERNLLDSCALTSTYVLVRPTSNDLVADMNKQYCYDG